MGVAIGVISIAIMFIVFPIVLDSSHTIQTDQETQTVTDVVTTSGTSATLTLTQALFKARVADVVSLSGGVGDTITVSTIPAGTKVVIGGLATSATRDVTIVYDVDALTDYTGLGAIVGIAPLIIFVSILGVAVAGTYFSFKRG
jgi:hypothetical protein